MKELLPIGIVLVYDILIAMVVITLRDIDWRKKGPNPDLDRIIAFVAIHLIFLLGIYSISRTGYIAWFDNHAWGNSGLRTSFVVINMVIFPIFIWFREKADPTIDWKLLRNIAMAGWLVPMVLCFFPIGCNSKSDDAVDDQTAVHSIVQPAGFPKDIRLAANEEVQINTVEGFCYHGIPDEGNLAVNEFRSGRTFQLKAGPNGVHLILEAVCKGNYHNPNLCPKLHQPTTIQK